MAERRKQTLVGIELTRRLTEQGDRIFSTDRARELAPTVGLKPEYVCEALYRLRKTGWIVPLRRGLYALANAGPGVTDVHEYEIAMALVQPSAIAYWSAFHHHGLTEQIPRSVHAVTTTSASVPRLRRGGGGRSRGGCVVNGVTYEYSQVVPERFFGVETVWISGAQIQVTDLERTLLDGLSKPRRCGGFAEVLHAFEVSAEELEIGKIRDYAFRFGPAVVKRAGWVLDHLGLASDVPELAEYQVQGYRLLDPSGPAKGACDRAWQVQVNLPGRLAA